MKQSKTVKITKTNHVKPKTEPHRDPEMDETEHGAKDVEDPVGDPNLSATADHRNRHAFLAEEDGVDNDDPNLSALFAETGVEERLDELGL